jgi:hypothetical protein
MLDIINDQCIMRVPVKVAGYQKYSESKTVPQGAVFDFIYCRKRRDRKRLIKNDHPAYLFRGEPEGSCQRGGTFML